MELMASVHGDKGREERHVSIIAPARRVGN
jgi:hypothetical protein